MRQRLIWLLMAIAAVMPAFGSSIYFADLNNATSFGMLGGTISNTGVSLVTGNVGGMASVTGFPPGLASGSVTLAGTTVTAAYDAIFNPGGVFAQAEGLTPSGGSFTTDTSQTFLGNEVYASAGDISTITGTNLTFNAQGDSNEVFVIQIDGALTVNGSMTFTLENGAQADNIFWIVQNIATISVGDAPQIDNSGQIIFDGNILAGTSFTMSAGSGGSGVLGGTINGCVFAETANTLAGQTDVGGCAGTTAGSPTGGGGTPEPGSAGLVSLGGLIGILAWRKLRAKPL
ncbi:MAG: ice-binding family protein [Bryobacteraceae bacterium]